MKKALKISGVILLAILLLLVLTPFLFQDRLKLEVKNLANKTLKSELNFTDMKVSFFSHFPNLSVTLTDFSLKSSAPFEKDTLISAKEVAFGVNVKSLFGKTILITRVYLEKAKVTICYNEKGAANYDVYQPADTVSTPADTTSSPGAELNIQHIIFKNCQVIYADPTIPVSVVANGLNYAGSSSMTSDFFSLTSDVKIDALDVTYDRWKIIDAKPVTAKLSTKVNSRDLSVVFEKNDLKIKDIPLQFQGKFNFEKNGYQVSLNFLSVMEKEFLSARFKIRQSETMWIFAKVNASIDLEKWSKALDVKSVAVKGFYELNLNAEGSYITGPVTKGIRNETDTVILSIPKFSVMSKYTGGYLKYASLPQSLDKISFSLNASCPDNNYANINVQLESLQAAFMKNQINGFFRMNRLSDIPVDINLTANCNLAELKQVIPLDSISLAGILSMDVKVKGNYAPEKQMFPVTTAFISLKDGLVQTKYYPHPLEKMEMLMEVTNHAGTLKDLIVDIKPLTFEFEGKPFSITAVLQNFDDIHYDVQSKGTIDLGKVYKVFSQKGLELDGFIETNLSLNGKQRDATTGNIEMLRNSGTLKLRNIKMSSDDYPQPFIIRSGDFRFDQNKIWFDNFLATYGRSDFRLKGFMTNTINYVLSQGGTLTGDFQLNSDFIDVDEFKAFASSDTPTTAKNTSQTGVVIIPRDLDIDFRAAVKKTSFEGLNIKDLTGEIDLKDGIMVLKGASFSLIDCKVNMDATYGSVTPVKGFFDFHIKADDFDIKRAYNEIAMIREMASSAEKAEGIVSLDYQVKGMLNADLFPVMPSLEGGGIVSIKKVKVYGLKLFNDISKGTQKEGISNPDLSRVDIKSTIRNNTITLEEFKFKVKGIRVKISGTTTFDSKLNMKVRLGMGPFGIIGIPMKITGTMEDLKIKYGRGKDADNLKESDYTDELPKEMLDRIKNAKEDAGDDEPEPPK
ncbi:MAG: AsmA family protein [Bacteroidetes bacterium]|nr:AsmA family protein [Bacteroidota bacterium]